MKPVGRWARMAVNWGILLTIPFWGGLVAAIIILVGAGFKRWSTGRDWVWSSM